MCTKRPPLETVKIPSSFVYLSSMVQEMENVKGARDSSRKFSASSLAPKGLVASTTASQLPSTFILIFNGRIASKKFHFYFNNSRRFQYFIYLHKSLCQ